VRLKRNLEDKYFQIEDLREIGRQETKGSQWVMEVCNFEAF
jgi:hypothetical protein